MVRQVAHVGRYTDGDTGGIGTYDVSVQAGAVDVVRRSVVPAGDNPSFLTVDPTGSFLYAVNETDPGSVTSFRRASDGSLSRLGRVTSGADGPCHCRVHPTGDHLFVAHYNGEAVTVLPIRDDGQAGPPSTTVRHEGTGVHPTRQSQAHPHAAVPGPNGEYLYVPDLGTDEVVVYRVDDGRLSRMAAVSVQEGAGPRHLTFHPDTEVAYLVNELDSTVTVFDWDPKTGTIRAKQTVSTLPRAATDDDQASAILVHPTGRFVFASNRGHDSVVVFEVDEEDGTLDTVGHRGCEGHWPRHVACDRTGRFLFVENMRSDRIVVFRVDETTGLPEPTGTVVETPSPSCLLFLDAQEE